MAKRVMSTEEREEAEANAFAFELLMPRDILMNEPALKGVLIDIDKETETLAEKYQVTIQVMTLRLIQLGLIKSPF